MSRPNAEDVAKAIASGIVVNGLPVRRVGRETAVGESFEPPCTRIERIGGQMNKDKTEDRPLLEFANFGETYEQAQAMTDALRDLMENIVGEEIAGVLIDSADEENGPIRPAWGNDARRDISQWRLNWRFED